MNDHFSPSFFLFFFFLINSLVFILFSVVWFFVFFSRFLPPFSPTFCFVFSKNMYCLTKSRPGYMSRISCAPLTHTRRHYCAKP